MQATEAIRPILKILKIRKIPLGMLIFMQKYFQFSIPRLKTQQPVLPYWTQVESLVFSVIKDPIVSM